MSKSYIIPLLVLLGILTAVVSAQEIVPNDDTVIDPNANISWPPPVYVLRGEVDIRGTVNVANLSNYFIEFRPLETSTETDTSNGEQQQEATWFPVTLPSSRVVVDDVLGTWNTETTEDGLYEIRLTINISNQEPINFVVSPIRVENEVPDFVVIDEQPQQQPAVVTATPSGPTTRPTLAASPTPLDTTPRVTANLDANVRGGDSTEFGVIGALRDNQDAEVLGISSSGSGWYYIRLPNGSEGWIAPSVVTASGDFRNVPRIAPPPPPFTPTPIPTNTPIASGNLAGSPPSLSPATPTCNVPFEVLVNITNNGTTATAGPATILIQDVHVATGEVQASFTRTVPVLAPGENFVVGNDAFTISTFFNEQHRIVVIIDSGNNVSETNENDNVLTTTYTLQQGGC